MNLQRLLLRAMLWMLAAAAAAGVLAIFASPQVMGRVAGTAFIAAVAVALAIPVSKFLDHEKQRSAGLVGLLGVVLSFLLALSAIWADLFFFGWQSEWRLAGSSCVLLVGSFVATAFLSQLRSPAMRIAAIVGVLADVAACAFFFVAIWSGPGEKYAETAAALIASGLPASLCLIGATALTRPWRWVGVLASVIALPMAIAGIWFVPSSDPSLYITVLCVAIAVAYANAVSNIPLGDSAHWAKPLSIGSMTGTAACVAALALLTRGFDIPPPELLSRVTGALGITTACATLGLAILYRLNRRPPGAAERASDISAVQLTCPHCSKKFVAPVNGTACPACGIFITIKVTEPKCLKCEYPLLGIKGEVCPECGTPRPTAPPA